MSDAAPSPSSTPASTPAQTPSSTPAPTLLDKIHDAAANAGHWIAGEKDALLHSLVSAGFSKPVAELVSTAEDAFSGLPAVLAAGEKSVLDQLTPEHLQALEKALVTLVGQIGAAGVKELLSRIPLALATATTTAAATV